MPALVAAAPTRARELTLEDRVEAQRAIEQVYWNHRIWPADNPGPKPPLSTVLPEAALRAKVEQSLHKASLLGSWWHQPLRSDQLQAEIDRMAKETRSPAVLRELFAALGNDPLLIAECLARPALAERRVDALYARDERIHGAQRARLAAKLAAVRDLAEFERLDGDHAEMTYIQGDVHASEGRLATNDRTVTLAPEQWARMIADPSFAPPGRAGISASLVERDDRFVALMVRDRTERSMTVVSTSWPKRLYEDWSRDFAVGSPLSAGVIASPGTEYAATLSEGAFTSCTFDTWSATATSTAPQSRENHSAVWTGSEMIVWGGIRLENNTDLNSGGRYDPATDAWAPVATSGAPSARHAHAAIWTGTEMIVWGGAPGTRDGGRYNPATDAWTATSTVSAPQARTNHTAVWTGSAMIVWGGQAAGGVTPLNTGGRYTPATNSWTATSTAGAPSARDSHTAVWTGSRMIVWGGSVDNMGNVTSTGAIYNPSSDAWTATQPSNSPSPRSNHTAVWTGSEMVVWGGMGLERVNTGGRYSLATDSWAATSIGANVPGPMADHAAVWTGSAMIVWGDPSGVVSENRGGWYIPATDTWGAPTLLGGGTRLAFSAVWTGPTDRRLLVWGGASAPFTTLNTGGLYCAGECLDGNPCSDGNPCTTDVCTSRTCVPTLIPCTPIDGCHDPGVCNPSTGICSVGSAKPDGIACEDGNPCTAACPTCQLDACVGGVCGCPNTPGPCNETVSYATRTVVSTDVPKPISSTGTPTVTSVINVSIAGRPILDDVNVQTFLRHTNASNIDMTLRSPAGTVVTLTTDNGDVNGDVFNGTVWDDSANPGGQVPYTTNHGLATDNNYGDNVLASPLAPEEALGAFIGENPNGAWTLTISDDTAGDGGTLDGWSMTMATLDVTAPTEATATYTGTQVPRTISASLANTVTSSITVAGAGASIGKVRVVTDITHTNNADLDITLRSPAGTIVTLSTDNGGTADNAFHTTTWDDDANPSGQVPYASNRGLASDHPYLNLDPALALAPEEALAAFRGEDPNGTWRLTISDDAASNGGALNAFSLEITTVTCPQSCHVSCNDNDTCTSDSCSPATGCQHACSPGAGCVPSDITNVSIGAGGSTLTWDHATGGTTSVHDVARGRTDQMPPGAADVCLAAGITATTLTDTTSPPPGTAFWYDVRGHHACGAGPWGSQSGGSPRTITVCP